MKLTNNQKDVYQVLCTSAICRCLIPNVTRIMLDLNDLERPKLTVFTRAIAGTEEHSIDLILTKKTSIVKYFKEVERLYGSAIVGISLETSSYFKSHMARLISWLLRTTAIDDLKFIYHFSTMADYKELTIDNSNWHTLKNVDDLRFEPMYLDRVIDNGDDE